MQVKDSAVEKLKDILAEENNLNLKLRVFVQGGGCSGMSYGFTLDEAQNEDDFDFDYDGIKILVDSMSWGYLQGSEIDYKDDAMGSSFVINNPTHKQPAVAEAVSHLTSTILKLPFPVNSKKE
jgi:iron-sulfur cluster insertion protein